MQAALKLSGGHGMPGCFNATPDETAALPGLLTLRSSLRATRSCGQRAWWHCESGGGIASHRASAASLGLLVPGQQAAPPAALAHDAPAPHAAPASHALPASHAAPAPHAVPPSHAAPAPHAAPCPAQAEGAASGAGPAICGAGNQAAGPQGQLVTRQAATLVASAGLQKGQSCWLVGSSLQLSLSSALVLLEARRPACRATASQHL